MATERPGWPEWIEGWILPYVRESALWPVLVALLGHVVVGLVPVLLGVYRGPSVAASLGLVVSLAVTAVGVGFEIRHLGRPGAVAGIGLATWASAVGVAVLCERTGVW